MGDIPSWGGFVLTILTTVAVGGAVYGAIRADLKHMQERLHRLERFQDSIGPMRNWWRESHNGDLGR